MPTQRESDINDFAFEYLRNHYITRFNAKNVLVDRAEQTKQGYTTDGLFSLKNKENELFIASLHTHYSPQIANALTRYKKNGLSRTRYATPLVVFMAAFMVGWQLIHLSLLVALSIAVPVAVLIFVLHTTAEKKYRVREIAILLDDLKKTPADEQWLGLSISSLTFRNNNLADKLLTMCERRGIGIITVGKRSKVVLIKEPRTLTCRRGDFLSYYESEIRIRKALLGDSYLRVA